MRLLLPIFWAVLLLCRSALSDTGFGLNPENGEVVPPVDAKGPVRFPDPSQEAEQSESYMFEMNPNLKWVPWNGSLPDGAVGIYNGYAGRQDYICKFNCEAGFYTPSKGDYCHYPYADQEYTAIKFDILVNQDGFEFIEWLEDSYGDVPTEAIKTCPREEIYVGKNKYGLGKVVAEHEAFFLPWEGEEYWYKKYHVLRINQDAYSQHLSHIEYGIDQIELFHHPPETIQQAKVTNYECREVEKTVLLEKTTTTSKTWDIGRETRNGTISTMKGKVPVLNPGSVDFTSKEQSVTFNEGTTESESITHTISVQVRVAPNYSCAVRMDARKMEADIPFTARLSRTYDDGSTHWTTVTGTYDGVRIGEINAVVERCQPIPDAPPC
ncbi:natterin-3-like [Engraulis encrasicolus]|uniref:natterin-3-like n=1 Tax=Engraulis encrasicolus TaxID=184585 RepID=UPI002FD285B4